MLRLAVLLAAIWAVAALGFLHRRAKAFGPRKLFAAPAGDPAAGARYAFTQGMAPWAKESVRLNLPSYAAGMLFHAGVFTGFVLLVPALLGAPAALADTRGVTALAAALALAGGACGLALLAKRAFKAHLRGLSVPDDFVSNGLTSLFALLAGAQLLAPGLTRAWLAEAVLLLAYAPLGKIRHCLFFFPTRYHFGAFFGRRGTFPPGGSRHA
jgi:hypothetical protein